MTEKEKSENGRTPRSGTGTCRTPFAHWDEEELAWQMMAETAGGVCWVVKEEVERSPQSQCPQEKEQEEDRAPARLADEEEHWEHKERRADDADNLARESDLGYAIRRNCEREQFKPFGNTTTTGANRWGSSRDGWTPW